MHDEEKVVECAQDKGLTVLGWIHTHPQYNLFFSSIDEHTQVTHQRQLAEFFGIVFSPIVAAPGYKALRIKDAMVDTVARCQKTGFHSHPGESASRPYWEECRHVQYVAEHDIDFYDLREQ